MARIRTFVAVDLPDALRQQLSRVIASLQREFTTVRWVEPDRLHVTLKFLGDVEDADLYAVCRQVEDVAAKHAAFTATCQTIGAFPKENRPRTIWAGIADTENQFEKLHADLDDALAGIGFPREVRRYRPHVTLGRVSGPRGRGRSTSSGMPASGTTPGDVFEQVAKEPFGSLSVSQLTVYSSELSSDGPIYTPLSHATLQA